VTDGAGGSGYQPLNECFIANLHSRLRDDGAGVPCGYQPFTWCFIEVLPSRVLRNGIGNEGSYQFLVTERIGRLLSHLVGDGFCGPSYQGFRPERIELLPSRSWRDRIDG
jgi:hypothetical protein